MREKNIFSTIGQEREAAMVESKKRLKATVEIEQLLDQLRKTSDSDIREEIEGRIRQLLEQGRRTLEKEAVDDYYRQMKDTEKGAA